ncbi:MAG TPA: hypothetical protein VHN55_10425 [Sphingomicrobium sp.]|nr:hypothetical protein [Sphingomicrobium sp.]
MGPVALRIAAICAAVLSTGAQAAAEPTVLKMEQFRRSVAVRVEVAGKERLFQFDTGGAISFISPEVATEIACEKGARVVGFRMTGDKLQAPRCDDVSVGIGGHRFTIPVAGVYQVGEFNAKGVTVDGLLALDVFAGRTITIDSAGLRLIIETPASAAERTARATELPARLVRELGGYGLAVDVQVPSKVGHLGFQLDSGNGGTILVAKPYAAAFGLDPDKGPQQGQIDIGKGIVAEGLVFPAGITLDGNLGMPFLKNYLVTLDLEHGRVWLAPNPVAPPPGMGVPPEGPPPK